MSRNILIVVGTRPEVIKLAPVIYALKRSPLKNNFIVASTSQHEELLDEQLDFWKITPDYFITPNPFKGNLTRLLSHTLSGLQDIIEQEGTIEYVIVQGDTNTALACSNLAFLNQMKLIHIEAGLRSFDFQNPFPEEFNRIIASKAAYFHFAPTENSKIHLLEEGIDPSKIMVIGNTVIDALYSVKNNGHIPEPGSHTDVIITLHRRENIDENYRVLIDAIGELANQHPHLKFTWITHPNCVNQIRAEIQVSDNVQVHDHLPYRQFINLYESAKIVITDSGGVSEEAIHLGLPVIIFREVTERTEAIAEHFPMIVSIRKEKIISFFNKHINSTNVVHYSYGDGNASQKIISWLCQETEATDYDLVIIGGGPSGTGLLLKAVKDGTSNLFSGKRIALIEKSSSLIKGNITQYKVNSDTLSDVFLECLEGATGDLIDIRELKEEIDFISAYKGSSIPLGKLDSFYNKLGRLLKEGLESRKQCDFILNTAVSKLVQLKNGFYEAHIENQSKPIRAKQVIIATGGIPQYLDNQDTVFGKSVSLQKFGNKIVHSDTILRSDVPEKFKSDLKRHPRVVILGGSHSAFSAAHFLLNSPESYAFGNGDIRIWCTKFPKIYFNTREDATAAGYMDFTEEDICPLTKKLYRLAGLRMDGRDLYLQMLGLGTSKREERVKLQLFTNQAAELEKDLSDATMVILAFGYKLNMFPFFNKQGAEIKLQGEYTNHWVNDKCELIDRKGEVVTNVFATGLATGFIPSGDLGGEPSFSGQTNGIWYYQNAIAEKIINNLDCEHPTSLS